MYLFLRAPAPLGSSMYESLRVPAPLRCRMYAFLPVTAPLGSRMYAFLRVPAPTLIEYIFVFTYNRFKQHITFLHALWQFVLWSIRILRTIWQSVFRNYGFSTVFYNLGFIAIRIYHRIAWASCLSGCTTVFYSLGIISFSIYHCAL